MLLGPSLTSQMLTSLGNNVTDRQRIRYSNPARPTTDPLHDQTGTSHRPTTSGCPYLGSHELTTPYNRRTDRQWTEGNIFNCMYWCNDQRCVSPRLEGKNSTTLPFLLPYRFYHSTVSTILPFLPFYCFTVLPFYCLTGSTAWPFLPFYRFYHFTITTFLHLYLYKIPYIHHLTRNCLTFYILYISWITTPKSHLPYPRAQIWSSNGPPMTKYGQSSLRLPPLGNRMVVYIELISIINC